MTLTLNHILALPLIGEGNFRRVYSDGRYVYKVEYDMGIDLRCNEAEARNARRLFTLRLPTDVAIPEVAYMLVDGIPVIRMPYIDGELMGECFCIPGESHEGCIPPGMERDLNAIGIDCAYGNIILSDSTYWLIDLDADLR